MNRALSRRSVESAREMEAKNPLSLAELFRFLLFFFDEEFTDDPQQQQVRTAVKFDGTRANGVNMPHIKGVAIENILMFVYQKYCRSDRAIPIRFTDYTRVCHRHLVIDTVTPGSCRWKDLWSSWMIVPSFK